MWHKFSLLLTRIANVVAVLFLSAMALVMLLGVFFRYFLVKPLPWGEDVARSLMVLLALFGVGVVMQNKGHVAVAVFVEMKFLPLWVKTCLLLLAKVLVLGFALVMGYLGAELLLTMRPQTIPTLGISIKWLYLGFPFWGFSLTVSTLDQIFEDIRHVRNSDLKQESEPALKPQLGDW